MDTQSNDIYSQSNDISPLEKTMKKSGENILKRTSYESGIRGTLTYLNINKCDVKSVLCLNNLGIY